MNLGMTKVVIDQRRIIMTDFRLTYFPDDDFREIRLMN